MRYFILPFIALLCINNTMAQGRPQLVFDKALSANFDKIKKGMNDLVKNFGKNPVIRYGTDYTTYELNFKIGNAPAGLKESKENQHLNITFTGSYYKGTVTDFTVFYDALVAKVTEMFASTHTADDVKRNAKHYEIAFFETGKTGSESIISVYISCDLYNEANPYLSIDFYRKTK